MYKFLSVILLLISLSALAQSKEKIKAGAVTLIDSATNWTYILDSSHKKITAFNEYRDSAWTTSVIFPELRNTSNRTDPTWNCDESIWRIEIINETIRVGPKKHLGDKIIFIEYESNCAAYCVGVVNLKTGKFHPKGCD